MITRPGWLGLGKMGAPMARNLLRAGYDLSVFNRSAEKSEPLRVEGAKVANSTPDLAATSDVLFVTMSDDAALRDVLLGEAGAISHLKNGSVLMEMSTVSVDVSADIADAAKASGIQYLRAPVSGSVALAEAGKLTALVSGPRTAYDKCLELLGVVSARQFYIGAEDEARIVKLAINLMVGFTAGMVAEAIALSEKSGVKRSDLLEVMGASAIASPLIGYKLDALRDRDYTAAFEVRQMAKDFDLILEAARRVNTPLPLAAQMRKAWSALIAKGDGGADFFKCVELAGLNAGLHSKAAPVEPA